MGRILHHKFRRYAEEIVEKYKDILTTDYKKNLRLLSILVSFPSKRVRNMVTGYITRKVKQLQEQ